MNTSKDISNFLDEGISSIVSASIVDIEIKINPDNKVKMILECPEKYMHRVKPYIANGALKINTEGNFSLDSPILVKVYLKHLDEITISGAGNLKGLFKGDKLKIKSSGVSDVELQGEVNELDLVMSGAGNAKMRNFLIQKLNLNLSGVSDAQVNVEKYCSVKISGVGNATVFGDPEVLKESISGLGKIIKGGKLKKSVLSKESNGIDMSKNIFYNVSKKAYTNTRKEKSEDNKLNDLIAELKQSEKNNDADMKYKMEIREADLKLKEAEIKIKKVEMEIEKFNASKHTKSITTPAQIKLTQAAALSKKIKSML